MAVFILTYLSCSITEIINVIINVILYDSNASVFLKTEQCHEIRLHKTMIDCATFQTCFIYRGFICNFMNIADREIFLREMNSIDISDPGISRIELCANFMRTDHLTAFIY